MNQGRIIVITGAPGTGKTTTASVLIVIKCI
jgi:broad-specificity NMP kinase